MKLNDKQYKIINEVQHLIRELHKKWGQGEITDLERDVQINQLKEIQVTLLGEDVGRYY